MKEDTVTTPTSPSPVSDRSARLNMRITSEALGTLREAAAAQSQDVTSFVLGAALDRARSVLMEDLLLRLTPAEEQQIDAALDTSARVIPELAAAIRKANGQRVQ